MKFFRLFPIFTPSIHLTTSLWYPTTSIPRSSQHFDLPILTPSRSQPVQQSHLLTAYPTPSQTGSNSLHSESPVSTEGVITGGTGGAHSVQSGWQTPSATYQSPYYHPGTSAPPLLTSIPFHYSSPYPPQGYHRTSASLSGQVPHPYTHYSPASSYQMTSPLVQPGYPVSIHLPTPPAFSNTQLPPITAGETKRGSNHNNVNTPMKTPMGNGYYYVDSAVSAGMNMIGGDIGPETPTPVRSKRISKKARAAAEAAAKAEASTGTPSAQMVYGQGSQQEYHKLPPMVYNHPHGHGEELPPIPQFQGRRATSDGIGAVGEEIAECRRSTASSPGPSVDAPTGGQVKRARGLEIKRSKTEGRRLVFPETPSPELEDMELSQDYPRTPPNRAFRTLSPRTVPIPALTTGPSGAAQVGENDVLASDAAWLAPNLNIQESPAAIRIAGNITTTPTKRPDAISANGSSEKKRKRIEAFKSGVAGKEPKLTLVSGYGRVATSKTSALTFLGMAEDERVEAVEASSQSAVLQTPRIGQQQGRAAPGSAGSSSRLMSSPLGLLTPRHTPQSTSSAGRVEDVFSSPVEPAWPDASFPWAEEGISRKKQVDKVKEVIRSEKLAYVERYLDSLSDEDTDEDVFLSRRRITIASDAVDALVNVTRNGVPVFDDAVHDDVESRRYLNAAPTSCDDTSSCLCRGSNMMGGGVVCCDECSTWFHMSCCGIESEEQLDNGWYCWQCEMKASPGFRSNDGTAGPPPPLSTSQPTFAATDDSSKGYHSHTGNTALAPSPVFSTSGRLPSTGDVGPVPSLGGTPHLSYQQTPRIPSSGASRYGVLATPGTPMNPRARVISYAEHYNVCQTPGDFSNEYSKIYSTPKFEDFFDGGFTPGNATSPTPGRRSRVVSRSNLAFTTPSTSQSFLQGLQSGTSSTPGLDHSSSIAGNYSPFPASPFGPPASSGRHAQSTFNDPAASPSPFRHRRQVSFNRVAYTATSSHLRDSVALKEEPLQGTPTSRGLKLGEELGEHVQRKGKGKMFSPQPVEDGVGLGFGIDGAQWRVKILHIDGRNIDYSIALTDA